DLFAKRRVRPGTPRGRSLCPSIVAAGGDTQEPTHRGDRIGGLVLTHEAEPFGGIVFVSRANQAAAFDRISRSTRSWRFSRRSWLSSSRSAVVSPPSSQAPDLVERNFTAERPHLLWDAALSYIPTRPGFLSLAVVLDACSRRRFELPRQLLRRSAGVHRKRDLARQRGSRCRMELARSWVPFQRRDDKTE